MLHRLTARFVATATTPGRHADGGNLYLSVSANGGRRYVFLYRWHGRTVEMGLGSAIEGSRPYISLARARDRAAEARALLADAKSPLEARQSQQAVPTFGEAADALIAALRPTWRNPFHARQWPQTLSRLRNAAGELFGDGYCQTIINIKVDAISTQDVLRVVKPIWQTKATTAARVRSRIEAVLDAAKAHGHRTGENPARLKGHLDHLLGPQTGGRGHHAAMLYGEVPAFVAALREHRNTSARALEFAILTAARTSEAIGAVWPEIDLAARTWTVPAARMKGNREHIVPLSDSAVAILHEMESGASGPLVFPGRGNRALSRMALTMALRRAGGGAFTVHGFRSSFRDWAGDETTTPREVAEAALAHAVRDATEAAYRRQSAIAKRRVLMAAWCDYIDHDGSDKIVSLAGRIG